MADYRLRVAIVGCGNIGSRVLQSIAQIETPLALDIVDGAVTSRETAATRAEEFDPALQRHKYHWLEDIQALEGAYSAVYILTSAGSRRAIIEALLPRIETSRLLLEKVMFQHPEDFEAVGALLTERNIDTWCHCPRRLFPGYAELASQSKEKRLHITVSGGAWGLASNATHMVDLYRFISGRPVTQALLAALSVVPSKRKGYVEANGTVTFSAEDGGTLTLECAVEPAPLVVSIQSGATSRLVFEAASRCLTAAGAEPFETRFVSQFPREHEALITGGAVALPRYDEAAADQKCVIKALSPEITRAGLMENDLCPIT